MSTIHNIHGDMTAGGSPLQTADEFAIWENSTGVPKKLTGSQVMAGSAGVVASTAGMVALTLGQASHANRTVIVNSTAPFAITMPTATGSGSRYRIFINAAATTTSSTIKVGNSTDVMRGVVVASTTSSVGQSWVATATDDTISINGSTKGGLVGDIYEFTDVASGVFSVVGHSATTGASATPFSSAV